MCYDLFLDLKVNCTCSQGHRSQSQMPRSQASQFFDQSKAAIVSFMLTVQLLVSHTATLTKVRYVLDFGIVRKMVFDEERAMQYTWHVMMNFSVLSLDQYLAGSWCNSRYLIDLRMTGAFVTHGALKQLADKATLPHFAWRSCVKNL